MRVIHYVHREVRHCDRVFHREQAFLNRADYLRQFPHAWHQTMTLAPLDEKNRPVAAGEGICDLALMLRKRSIRHSTLPTCSAECAYGAVRTAWLGGQTDGCAEFHHGLIEVTGAGAIQ